MLNMVKKYIDDNNCRPSSESTNTSIKELGRWICHQITSSKGRENIMKNDIIYNKWNEFINNSLYKKYFLSNEDNWINMLDMVKKYIEENNKKPLQYNTKYSNNSNIKSLGIWLSHSINNYKKQQKIMKDEEIRKKWEQFINDDKYKKYLINTNEE
jgi:hypothetical protein